ncbi:outer membrane lipoprotein chaperone LolA [uncultured Abyssibacter sp.]|uniref:outer membrane lipoprotein chaperone LolA n=1 Tax=uncultured Abyssibacter sp. TaxID=2320202 RepID=UPI0032B16895
MTMTKTRAGWAALGLTLLSMAWAPARADSGELADALGATRTLAGVFEQTLSDSDGLVLEASRGQFSLSRPGAFRWDYEQPYVQKVICDGDTIWHYDQDLAQVTVRTVGDALSATPAALLSGAADLDETFAVEDLGDGRYRLTPRTAEAEFESATVQLEDGVIRALEIDDALGQRTRIEFSDVARNVQFRDGWFRFEPPPGVEVVGEPGA